MISQQQQILLFADKLTKIETQLKEEVVGIRTGRASPSLVENIVVDAYKGQSKLKLKEMSTITTDGAAKLVIIPFDVSTIEEIERAILASPLNLTPSVAGHTIQINIPALSQEQRESFLKLVGQKVEEARAKIRGARDEARKKIKMLMEEKQIGEDERFRLEKEIDKATGLGNASLDQIREKKANEIMAV